MLVNKEIAELFRALRSGAVVEFVGGGLRGSWEARTGDCRVRIDADNGLGFDWSFSFEPVECFVALANAALVGLNTGLELRIKGVFDDRDPEEPNPLMTRTLRDGGTLKDVEEEASFEAAKAVFEVVSTRA